MAVRSNRQDDPKRTKKRQCLPPWVSPETAHHLNKLATLRKKVKSGRGSRSSQHTVEAMEAFCSSLQEQDRVMYEGELFSTRNKSGIFKYSKSFNDDSLPPKMTMG